MISEFSLYCDPHFEVNAYANRTEDCTVFLPRLSVIEYNSVTLNLVCLGQIIGIVEFDGTIQCVVSRFIEEDERKTHRKLPYPLFKYAMEVDDSTRFAFEHVPVEDIRNPCFSIPALDHDNMELGSTGRHHAKKKNMSYFYVITPDRKGLVDEPGYVDYCRYNDVAHPWDNKLGSENCLNFNYYLNEEEMYFVRDVLNK